MSRCDVVIWHALGEVVPEEGDLVGGDLHPVRGIVEAIVDNSGRRPWQGLDELLDIRRERVVVADVDPERNPTQVLHSCEDVIAFKVSGIVEDAWSGVFGSQPESGAGGHDRTHSIGT